MVRHRGVDARGAGDPAAILHQPGWAGLRAREPARGRQGRTVRSVLAHDQVAAPALPRRVREGHPRLQHHGLGRDRARGEAVRQRVLRVRRRLGRAARRRAPGVRAGLPAARQGDRVGAPGGVPRAVDALHALRRPARRAVAAVRSARDRGDTGGARLPGLRDAHVRGLRADVRADAGVLPGAVPQGAWGLRLRLPVHDHGQDVRHAARPAAGRHAVQPGRVRRRPGLRDDAAADARPSARRGSRVRGPDPRRAPQGDPLVPQARRSARPGRRLVGLPARHARGHGRDRGQVHGRDGVRRPRHRHDDRVRPARRGEGRRRGALRRDRPTRRPAALARALDERRGAHRRPSRVRRGAGEPPPQARPRVRAHHVPLRHPVRLRRVPRPAAPPPAHARMAEAHAPARLRDARADRRGGARGRVARGDARLGRDLGQARRRRRRRGRAVRRRDGLQDPLRDADVRS